MVSIYAKKGLFKLSMGANGKLGTSDNLQKLVTIGQSLFPEESASDMFA